MKIKYLAVKDENHPFKAWLFNAISVTFAFLGGPIMIICLIGTGMMAFEPFSSEMTMEPLLLYRAASIGFIISLVLFLYLTFKKDKIDSRSIIVVSIISILLVLPFIVCIFIESFFRTSSPDLPEIAIGVFSFIFSTVIPFLMIFFSARRIKSAREYL